MSKVLGDQGERSIKEMERGLSVLSIVEEDGDRGKGACMMYYIFQYYFQEAIAYFPLVVLISGVLASLGVKTLTKKLGSKVCIRSPLVLVLKSCSTLYLITSCIQVVVGSLLCSVRIERITVAPIYRMGNSTAGCNFEMASYCVRFIQSKRILVMVVTVTEKYSDTARAYS
jgi:hypothetical protein